MPLTTRMLVAILETSCLSLLPIAHKHSASGAACNGSGTARSKLQLNYRNMLQVDSDRLGRKDEISAANAMLVFLLARCPLDSLILEQRHSGGHSPVLGSPGGVEKRTADDRLSGFKVAVVIQERHFPVIVELADEVVSREDCLAGCVRLREENVVRVLAPSVYFELNDDAAERSGRRRREARARLSLPVLVLFNPGIAPLRRWRHAFSAEPPFPSSCAFSIRSMSATAFLASAMFKIPFSSRKPPGGRPPGGEVFEKKAAGYFLRRPFFFGAAWLNALAAAALSSLLDFGSLKTWAAAEAAFFPVLRCFAIVSNLVLVDLLLVNPAHPKVGGERPSEQAARRCRQGRPQARGVPQRS